MNLYSLDVNYYFMIANLWRKTGDSEHSRENRAWEVQICNWGNCAVISGSL